ncbi:hypothetical protein PIB30_025609 [Stylosanthes scabra]|uniref:Epidermal patterning factor-like protein n=1 Tax=Stylosanthes scabra TaxID=79078 RepID=A0ABU6T9T3_9FABA|nr:hypothetical protein [Stylosanthes scabra]
MGIQDIPSPVFDSTQGSERKLREKGNGAKEEEEESKGLKLKRLGSKPPRCEHKCGGCIPCDPIQMPKKNNDHLVGVQYANYEPEGWKCKCGNAYFTP